MSEQDSQVDSSKDDGDGNGGVDVDADGSKSGSGHAASRVKKEELLQKLQREREVLEKLDSCPTALKLILDEISRLNSGRQDPVKPVDLNRDVPVNLHARVRIPHKEFPNFNFVGRLLGPKGTSLQRLQQDTATKMTVGGRGCMKDRAKEEQLRQSTDPKFAHLHEELHLDVHAYAPPAEAYARMACALAELRRFLVPVGDKTDDISQAQLRQMELIRAGAGTGVALRSPFAGGGRPLALGHALPPPHTMVPGAGRHQQHQHQHLHPGPFSAAGLQNGAAAAAAAAAAGMHACVGSGPGGHPRLSLAAPLHEQSSAADAMRHRVMSIVERVRKNQFEFANSGYAYGLPGDH